MPQQTNLKQIKEAARARGLNVEWLPETLQGQQGQPPQQGQPMQGQPMQAPPQGYSQTMAAPAGPMPGQAPPAQANLHPEAQAMMEAIGQYQRSTGPYIPFPGGTPTLQGRQLAEQARQFDETMAWNREKMAASQATSGGGQGTQPSWWWEIAEIAADAVKEGMPFDQVVDYIQARAPYYGGQGNTQAAERAALMFYEQALRPQYEMARSGALREPTGKPDYILNRMSGLESMYQSAQKAGGVYYPTQQGYEVEKIGGNIIGFKDPNTGVIKFYREDDRGNIRKISREEAEREGYVMSSENPEARKYAPFDPYSRR